MEENQVIDLFCGCGGMSLGLQNAGFKIIGAYDNWDAAIRTYNANNDHQAQKLDLGDLEAVFAELEQYRGTETKPGIVGGPPCQDFSSAGTRVEGRRADLTERFADTIAWFQPPFFVMENVERAKHSAAYSRALQTMISAGYEVSWGVVDAAYYRVPQRRKRLIAFGAKEKRAALRAFNTLTAAASTGSMTIRDQLPTIDTNHYYRHPRSYARRGVFSVDEPSTTIRGQNRPIPSNYVQHPGDSAPTDRARVLTTAERAQIQTFPKDFVWTESKTATEQMIGNAVPIKLAEAVGLAIRGC